MRVLGSWLVFLGLTFIVLGIKTCSSNYKILKQGVSGEATVVTSYHKERSDETDYFLRLEMPDPQKTRVSCKVNRKQFAQNKEGAKIAVVYQPDDPSSYRLGTNESVEDALSTSFWMVILGPIFLAAGLFMIVPRGFEKPALPSFQRPRGKINWFGYLLILTGIAIGYFAASEFWFRHRHSTPTVVDQSDLKSPNFPNHARFPDLHLDVEAAYGVYRSDSWDLEYVVLPFKLNPEDENYALILQASSGPFYSGLSGAALNYHRNDAISRFWEQQRGTHSVDFWREPPFEVKFRQGIAPTTLFGAYDGPTSNLWPGLWLGVALFLIVCGALQRAGKEELREQLREAGRVVGHFAG